MAYHYVNYEEAQELIPGLEAIVNAKDCRKDIRALSQKFLQQLRLVREDVDYVRGGFQVYFPDSESQVFDEVIKWARDRRPVFRLGETE